MEEETLQDLDELPEGYIVDTLATALNSLSFNQGDKKVKSFLTYISVEHSVT